VLRALRPGQLDPRTHTGTHKDELRLRLRIAPMEDRRLLARRLEA
jgi:hypothetical protein